MEEALQVYDKLNELNHSNKANLVWATPYADEILAYIARVSNPANQLNQSVEGLFSYMEEQGHVSPFDMVNLCVEVNTTRDIGRQFLRHWSIKPQEFSQRYQSVDKLGGFIKSECRMQDSKNRQNSLACSDEDTAKWWSAAQDRVIALVDEVYKEALQRGIAKEVSRKVLPEGLTPSRLYFNGTARSWIHYLRSRLDPSTQKEHREVAEAVFQVFKEHLPKTTKAFFPEKV